MVLFRVVNDYQVNIAEAEFLVQLVHETFMKWRPYRVYQGYFFIFD